MLLSDTKLAVHASGGYFEMTNYVTEYEGTGSTEFASRTLVGRKHMWKQPTTTMYDGSINGYVLSENETRFDDIFVADELALWMVQYPNGRVDVMRAYITEDSMPTDDEGVFVMDIPLESSGGYLTTKTYTALRQGGLDVDQNDYLFYWLTDELKNGGQVDVAVNGLKRLTDITTAPGLYLVDLEMPNAETSVDIEFQFVGGSQATGSTIRWGYGGLQ